jgi:hypothetical protein
VSLGVGWYHHHNYNQLLIIQQHQRQRQHNLHFFQRQEQLQLQQQHQRQQYLFFQQEHQLQQNLLAAENVGTANLNNVVSDGEVNYSNDVLFSIGGGNYIEHDGFFFLGMNAHDIHWNMKVSLEGALKVTGNQK